MTINIPAILFQIRALLRDYTSKNQQNTLLNQQRIDSLLQKIEACTQHPSNILNAILISPAILSKMKELLLERLLRESTQTTFLDKYAKEACKPREEYQIQKSSLNSLIREIFDSSKPIEEELQKLKLNLETCQNQQPDRLFDSSIDSGAMSVGSLLRMVMEATQLDLDNCFDQMLFRIFLLEQSLILIFHKAEYVLQQLSLTIEDERDEEPKSPSVKTKRSALSQSIEIYKSNQKKKEEEASKLMQEKKSHHTVIKTDYQLICKTEKRLPRAQRKANCCF